MLTSLKNVIYVPDCLYEKNSVSLQKNTDMILIADSGSTKTDWCLSEDGKMVMRMGTQGINPVYMSDDEVSNIIKSQLLEEMGREKARCIDAVFFYGAGVLQTMRARMTSLLALSFGVDTVEVRGDLLGAARALFDEEDGVACILGTGSNSGLFVGGRIVANTPPLGFILGDEGSGAVLGKLFLGALCKGLLPDGLLEEYLADTHQDIPAIIRAVYREPLPNRYLAKASMFVKEHLHIPEVRQIVIDNFRNFFRRNITPYHRNDLPVRMIGSVAYHFLPLLQEAAKQEGFIVDKVEQSPMEGLLRYHSKRK